MLNSLIRFCLRMRGDDPALKIPPRPTPVGTYDFQKALAGKRRAEQRHAQQQQLHAGRSRPQIYDLRQWPTRGAK